MRDDKGAIIIGPANPEREAQNLDRFAPQATVTGQCPA